MQTEDRESPLQSALRPTLMVQGTGFHLPLSWALWPRLAPWSFRSLPAVAEGLAPEGSGT